MSDNSHLLLRALDRPVSGTPTAIARRPSQLGRMLEALNLEPGHRVLQTGLVTGYTTALLAHRLGRNRLAVGSS